MPRENANGRRAENRIPLSVTPLFATAQYRLHHDRHSSHRQIAELVKRIDQTPLLDVGAAFGFLGLLLKDTGYSIDAVEPNPVWAQEASQHYRKVFACSVEEAPLEDGYYGTIVCADVLEHTVNPAAILRQLRPKTRPGSRVIISVPNIAHLSARAAVALGKFPRMERGIFDRTHLQFFTLDTLKAMLTDAGLELEDVRSTPVPLAQALGWPPQSRLLRGLMATQWPIVRLWPTLFSYQWIVVARWKSDGKDMATKDMSNQANDAVKVAASGDVESPDPAQAQSDGGAPASGGPSAETDTPVEAILLAKLIRNAQQTKGFLSSVILAALILTAALPVTHSFALVAQIGETKARLARPLSIFRAMPSGLLPINGGQGLEVLPNGTIVFADTNNRRVVAFSGKASAAGNVWSLPAGQEAMSIPYDVASGPDGSAYVLDTSTGKVHVFTQEGQFQRTLAIGAPGARGVCVDGEGNIFVADTGLQRVTKARPDGKLDSAFGGLETPGAITTRLEMDGIAVLDGSIYVTARDAIYRINGEGKRLDRLQTRSVNYGITIGPDHLLYTTDIATDRVWVISPEGEMVATLVSQGPAGSRFGQPRGLAFDRDGRLYVMNNDHVTSYEIGGAN